MKKPHSETLALLDRLNRPDSFLHKLTGAAPQDKVECLGKLGDIADLWVIPSIFHFVFHSSAKVAASAAAAIHKIITSHPQRRLPELDHLVRQVSMGYRVYTAHYPNLKSGMHQKISRLAQMPEFAGAMLGIASFDASGYVRQAAVIEMERIGDPAAIPFLLIRLGDWVKPVREAAQTAMSVMIKIQNSDALLESLDLAAQLAHRQRMGAGPLQEIKALVSAPEARPILFKRLGAPFSPNRRECVRLLLEDASIDPLLLKDRIAGRLELIEEWLIAKEAFKRTPDSDAVSLYEKFEHSPHGQVRMLALEHLLRLQPEGAREALWRAIFDNSMVRAFARGQLIKRGVSPGEIAQAYRDGLRVDSPKRIIKCLTGLGEMGDAADAELIAPFMSNPQVGIAKAAIHALSRLDPDRFFPDFVRHLQAEAPGVSKQAREEILKNLSLADFDELWSLYKRTATAHVRRNMFIIFNAASKWDRLWLLLGVAQLPHEDEKALARGALANWIFTFNRSYTMPSSIQQHRIHENLDALLELNNDTIFKEIRFLAHP